MKINIFCVLITLVVFASCKKETVEIPNVDVTIASTEYKVGDTVRFNFSGYADNITFYSGDKVSSYPTLLGYRYQYRDRDWAEGSAYLQFQSLLQIPGQQNTLSVLASNDFNGKYDSASIYLATWKDITSKVTLSGGTLPTAIPSGLADISEFKNKPFFLAFRYRSNSGTQQPKWTISNLSMVYYATGNDLTPVTKDTFTVATLNPAFRAINISNSSQVWSSSTSQLQITGGNSAAASNEDWVISRDYYLNRVPTDKGIPIKSYIDVMPTVYTAVYKKPGSYQVDFVSSNANSKGQKFTYKSFFINIR